MYVRVQIQYQFHILHQVHNTSIFNTEYIFAHILALRAITTTAAVHTRTHQTDDERIYICDLYLFFVATRLTRKA